jgi:hypothetical protein
VLHAPADEDIETIDELLHLAIQPGTCSLRLSARIELTNGLRISLLLRRCFRLLRRNDL